MKQTHVHNVMFCSGGGIASIFFTLGALGYLVEHDLFLGQYDVISAISGSTIPIALIEICYENQLVYERNWFKKYVVRTIHRAFTTENGANFLLKLFAGGRAYNIDSLVQNLTDIFVAPLPKRRRRRAPWSKQQRKKKPVFIYNYIDANKIIVRSDHSDLVNDPCKWVKTILRCILPFTNFNNIPTIDPGEYDVNILPPNVFAAYSFDVSTIISIGNNYQYDRYPPINTLPSALATILNNLFNVSNISSIQFASIFFNNNSSSTHRPPILVTISNQLHPSRDEFHRDVFVDWSVQNQSFLSLNAFDTFRYPTYLVLENEGYIQCRSAFIRSAFLPDSRALPAGANRMMMMIPNPSVYRDAKQIIKSCMKSVMPQNK